MSISTLLLGKRSLFCSIALKGRLCRADIAGAVQKLISIAGDQLASWQDSLYSATVTDEETFRYLSFMHHKSNQESQITREYMHHGILLN